MIVKALAVMLSALAKVTLASLVLWAGAHAARVRKRQWIRAWLCAALLYGVSLVLCSSLRWIPLVGTTVGAAGTALLWFAAIGGAFDTTDLKAAALLAISMLVYPGWTFGVL